MNLASIALATQLSLALGTTPAEVAASELPLLFKRCAPSVAPETMAAVVRVESAANPYAIGVVGGRLERQPHSLEEAVITAEALERAGWNFSVGLAQVNRFNLARFGLTYRTAFEPCANLRAGSKLLEECYLRAVASQSRDALGDAVSCYYSGNFERGHRQEPDGSPSYVSLVLKRPASAPEKSAPPSRDPSLSSPATAALTPGVVESVDPRTAISDPRRPQPKPDAPPAEPQPAAQPVVF